MKKLILTIMILLGVYAAKSQATIGFGLHKIAGADNLVITGTDTTIYRYVFSEGQSFCWQSVVSWTGVTGVGTVNYQTSLDGTNFNGYNGLTQVTVTGTTGNDGGKEDCMGNGTIMAIKITKGTISAGTLTWYLYIKRKGTK